MGFKQKSNSERLPQRVNFRFKIAIKKTAKVTYSSFAIPKEIKGNVILKLKWRVKQIWFAVDVKLQKVVNTSK